MFYAAYSVSSIVPYSLDDFNAGMVAMAIRGGMVQMMAALAWRSMREPPDLLRLMSGLTRRCEAQRKGGQADRLDMPPHIIH